MHKTIILERYLPETAKTIKPIQIGGLAGGEKYITQGILFKVCSSIEIENLYNTFYFSLQWIFMAFMEETNTQ